MTARREDRREESSSTTTFRCSGSVVTLPAGTAIELTRLTMAGSKGVEPGGKGPGGREGDRL